MEKRFIVNFHSCFISAYIFIKSKVHFCKELKCNFWKSNGTSNIKKRLLKKVISMSILAGILENVDSIQKYTKSTKSIKHFWHFASVSMVVSLCFSSYQFLRIHVKLSFDNSRVKFRWTKFFLKAREKLAKYIFCQNFIKLMELFQAF